MYTSKLKIQTGRDDQRKPEEMDPVVWRGTDSSRDAESLFFVGLRLWQRH